MAIHIGLILTLDNDNIQYIIIITNSLLAGKKILNVDNYSFQKFIILIIIKIKTFLKKKRQV